MNSHNAFRFCALAGVCDVRLVGEEIRGRWKQDEELTRYYGPPKELLVQKFVNWRDDPDSAVKFTSRYGPLYLPPEPGKEFSTRVEYWRNQQMKFRTNWGDIVSSKNKKFDFYSSIQHSFLSVVNGELELCVGKLADFLVLELCLCDRKRLRVCAAEDCHSPYFIAPHGRQQYCSDLCAQVGQRKAKLRWWAVKGPEWRDKRNRT